MNIFVDISGYIWFLEIPCKSDFLHMEIEIIWEVVALPIDCFI